MKTLILLLALALATMFTVYATPVQPSHDAPPNLLRDVEIPRKCVVCWRFIAKCTKNTGHNQKVCMREMCDRWNKTCSNCRGIDCREK
ncbi:hypothetical protein BU26DRAFT_611474 [Trematosphaeria pertusa]|uniref:ShKT domain-containing protein n=1 Tax=Trematosphaeria pertusa TaxID=390896 RepID=A0A6A6HSV2_9PLEO|nr:uncharacterized protein BU26DRAFT_611474 [Trematosphaeria pertusa]KAF2240603.1 hypothetical protein BU26DRAFT_611474 [Trematosphaeria pertusa]